MTTGCLPLPVTRDDREERARRVAEIARQVASGDYRVPAEAVAEAVAAAVAGWRR